MADTTHARFEQTRLSTHRELNTIAQSKDVIGLSRLTLPEVEDMANEVARVLPAGNVPAMILSGLARLPVRQAPMARRDVNMLFKGVELALDKAVYGTFFAGPAAVIWGYQNLLKLAGKDPSDAFPEGVWQFYVDYALREDTARHANETHGFDSVLAHHNIKLPYVDRITAWVMAAIQCLHQYPIFLENEWRERVYIHLLLQVVNDTPHADEFKGLYRHWELQRPYRRTHDALPYHSYAEFRREMFDNYLKHATRNLPLELKTDWLERIDKAKATDLPTYQKQMSILAYLETGKYGEERVPIEMQKAAIGVIYKGRYFLIPACSADQPADIKAIRAQVMAILAAEPEIPPAQLNALACIQRSALHQIRGSLNPELQAGLNQLRHAPILLNFDARAVDLPLAELRQTERGCGDHALTLFDTGHTFIFDQSHIFFDGEWGAAFAEIMTNQALSAAVMLSSMETPQPSPENPSVISLPFETEEINLLRRLPHVTLEACAENHQIHIQNVRALRHVLKQRNDFLALLTVNDLLLLYRAIHAITYVPNRRLVAELQAMQQQEKTHHAATSALEALHNDKNLNPTVMIPVSAGMRSPRDRVYPLSFEVPLHSVDFLTRHQQVMNALNAYGQAQGHQKNLYDTFKHQQKSYLTALAAIAEVLNRVKTSALQGASTSAETIKLLAHMPTSLQRFLDKIPERFDVLNDLIKGREVFSNVGVVVPSSTLRRFITAKDDNEKKTLCWGVITDSDGVMHLSLRDFRPHVAELIAVGRKDIADRMAQDYLDMYAVGFNQFIRDLRAITLARPITSPETDFSPVPYDEALLGLQIGTYRIDQPLHFGRQLYKGWDTLQKQPVLIKIADADERIIQRVQRVIGWQHDAILPVYDLHCDDKHCYLIMQYVEAESLDRILMRYAEEGKIMPLKEVLTFGRAIASALNYAGEHGLSHNVMPSDILRTAKGEIYVANFGLYPRKKDTQATTQSLAILVHKILAGVVRFDNYMKEVVALWEINYEISPKTSQIIKGAISMPGQYDSPLDFIDTLASTLSTDEKSHAWLELPAPPANSATPPNLYHRLTSHRRKTQVHTKPKFTESQDK